MTRVNNARPENIVHTEKEFFDKITTAKMNELIIFDEQGKERIGMSSMAMTFPRNFGTNKPQTKEHKEHISKSTKDNWHLRKLLWRKQQCESCGKLFPVVNYNNKFCAECTIKKQIKRNERNRGRPKVKTNRHLQKKCVICYEDIYDPLECQITCSKYCRGYLRLLQQQLWRHNERRKHEILKKL